MNITPQELHFLMSAMQNLSTKQEAYFQQVCDCDSRSLYLKLYDELEDQETLSPQPICN